MGFVIGVTDVDAGTAHQLLAHAHLLSRLSGNGIKSIAGSKTPDRGYSATLSDVASGLK
jgi:hypothetical protein